MPPLVVAAAITGGAALAGQIASSKAAAGANKRATSAQERAAQRAEQFEVEQDTKNRADESRRDAEDKRRWDVEQANLATQQQERDARQQYEDQIRYRKMVNIARLTGQPMPDALPNFSGGEGSGAPLTIGSIARPPVSQPIMSAPSQANAMITAPVDPLFNPLADLNTRVSPGSPMMATPLAVPTTPAARIPLRTLGARRY